MKKDFTGYESTAKEESGETLPIKIQYVRRPTVLFGEEGGDSVSLSQEFDHDGRPILVLNAADREGVQSWVFSESMLRTLALAIHKFLDG